MDRCVDDVMGKDSSLDKQAAIAICYTSIAGKEATSDKQHGGAHAGHGGAHGEPLKPSPTRRDAREEFNTINKRLAVGDLKPGERELLEKRAEIAARTILEVPSADEGSAIQTLEEIEAMVRADMGKESTKETNPIQEIIDFISAKFKAGARHSGSDQKALDDAHEAIVKAGANCPMSVFKQADGKYRWVLISSTAFEDRDGEIVSTKAQENDIASLDKSGDYGVLRWWHVGRPYATKAGDWRTWTAGKGVDLGVCDFSAMHGRVRIESGTFNNNEVGARLKEVANNLSVSIGFSHPETEPDRGGVFENIHTFERSLLPRGKQSNYFVSIPIIEKESNMDNKKIAALKELLGMNADEVISKAELTDKAAEATGVAFKEDKKPFMFDSEESAKAFMTKCMDEYMEAKAKKPEAAAKEAQVEATLSELQTTLKQLGDNDKQIATALNQLGAISKKNAEAIATLTGELPRSLKNLKPSESDDNLVATEKVEKTIKQLANPAGQDDFFTWSATGKNGQAAPVA